MSCVVVSCELRVASSCGLRLKTPPRRRIVLVFNPQPVTRNSQQVLFNDPGNDEVDPVVFGRVGERIFQGQRLAHRSGRNTFWIWNGVRGGRDARCVELVQLSM